MNLVFWLTLLFWVAVGITADIVVAWAHRSAQARMSRAVFIPLALTILGIMPLGYALFWAAFDQAPPFSLTPALYFALTMFATAAAYSVANGATRAIAYVRAHTN